MRRKDKELTDIKAIQDILQRADIIHIGMIDGNRPYVIPVNFGFSNNTIYFHCAKEGKKIDLIKGNNNVCFQTEIDVEVIKSDVAYKCGTYYRSVVGFGRAYILEDPVEKKRAADILMNHYHPDNDGKHQYGSCLKDVCMIKIEVESMTGKASLPEGKKQ